MSRIVAVVDVGSTAIRMVIAELLSSGNWRTLDRAGKPVPLGRDVFVSGKISRETMIQAIKILNGFRELLEGWKISLKDVRIIATSAIREARNRDTFIDRIFLRTGFKINPVEGIEENHLTYLAVQHALKGMRSQLSRSSSLIIEVGGGSTEIMLLRRAKMVAAHSLRLGTVRMEQQLLPSSGLENNMEDVLRENIRGMKEILDSELPLTRIKSFVAVGGDARKAAMEVGKKEQEHISIIRKEDFIDFINRITEYSIDDIVQKLGISYHEAEGFLPALLIYKLFITATSAEELIIPDVSIREGMLITFALGSNEAVEKQFYTQVIASAVNLGRKYHFDEGHARHVSHLGLMLFDQFQKEHGLDRHSRLILEAAAILHDIGTYVRTSGHHKHSQYLTANSELFGFSRGDMRILSNVVRYHRKATPTGSHTNYISLNREDRLKVLKLSAMLRVADALDRGHVQRIRGFTLESREEDLILRCSSQGDMSIEKYGLALKSDMFEEVFGYHVVIE